MTRPGAVLLSVMLAMSVIAEALANSQPEALFPSLDAPAEALAVDSRRIYVGGRFTQVVTPSPPAVGRFRLAAIDARTLGLEPSWTPTAVTDAIVTISTMVLSPDGRRLYVGGDFSRIGGQLRDNLAVIDTEKGAVIPDWNPGVSGPVRSLTLSPDGAILFVGGEFTGLAGGQAHDYLAAIDTLTATAAPWRVDADGPVLSLALSTDGSMLYAGGAFSRIGGQARARLAAIEVAAARVASAWQIAVDAPVRALSLDETGQRLYLGGDFLQLQLPAAAAVARSRLARVSLAPQAAVIDGWGPVVSAPIRSLALSTNGAVIYAGGDFTLVDGQGRDHLAALATDASGQLLGLAPSLTAAVTVDELLLSADERLFVGGDYSLAPARNGLAAFDVRPPRLSATPAPAAYTVAQTVSLGCVDNLSLPCSEIRYTLDGSDPRGVAGQLYVAPFTVAAEKSRLRYLGLGGEGLWADEAAGDYFVDTTAPQSSNSLPPGRYGRKAADAASTTSMTLQDIILGCQDTLNDPPVTPPDPQGSGCQGVYYTLDGTPPQVQLSHLYHQPIDLATYLATQSLAFADITLRYFAVDAAGNREAEQQALYQVDLTTPVVTVDPLGGSYQGPLTLTITCTDSGSGCQQMYYTLDGSQPSDGTVRDSNDNLIPVSSIYNGPITLQRGAVLEVLAIDRAGNRQSGLVAIYSFNEPVSQGGKGTGAVDIALLLLPLFVWLSRSCRRHQ